MGEERRRTETWYLLCPYTFCSPNCCWPIWVSQISWIHKYRNIAVKAWFPGNTASIDFEIVVLHNSKMQCILALGGSCEWRKAEASHTPAQRNYTSHATALLPSLPVSPEMAWGKVPDRVVNWLLSATAECLRPGVLWAETHTWKGHRDYYFSKGYKIPKWCNTGIFQYH